MKLKEVAKKIHEEDSVKEEWGSKPILKLFDCACKSS